MHKQVLFLLLTKQQQLNNCYARRKHLSACNVKVGTIILVYHQWVDPLLAHAGSIYSCSRNKQQYETTTGTTAAAVFDFALLVKFCIHYTSFIFTNSSQHNQTNLTQYKSNRTIIIYLFGGGWRSSFKIGSCNSIAKRALTKLYRFFFYKEN